MFRLRLVSIIIALAIVVAPKKIRSLIRAYHKGLYGMAEEVQSGRAYGVLYAAWYFEEDGLQNRIKAEKLEMLVSETLAWARTREAMNSTS